MASTLLARSPSRYFAPVTEVGDRVLPNGHVTSADRDVTGVGLVQRCTISRNQTPHLGDQLLVHLASHVASQLAADVGKSVFTRLIGVKIISSEHCTTGGDGAVLGGSLGLLAGVVTRLVQTPGVRAVDALLDVVEGCEERQLNASTNGVIQASVSCQNARGVESGLLEDFLLQIATERC